jgi:hypothetical protein
MEKLLKKHELEKQTAIQDFESYKIKATDMAQRISRDYRGKFESQEQAINDMNKKYQEKITNFEACSDELNLSLEKSKSSNSVSIDKMRSDHKVKMEELVRTNDENAKKMFQEHLNTLGMFNLSRFLCYYFVHFTWRATIWCVPIFEYYNYSVISKKKSAHPMHIILFCRYS